MCLTREIAKFSQARNNYECFKMQRRGGSIISLSFTALLWVLRIPQLIPTGAPSRLALTRWWRPSLYFLSHRHCLWEPGAFRKSWESPGTFPPVLGGPQGGSVVPTAEMGRMTVSPEWSWSQWCRSAQWREWAGAGSGLALQQPRRLFTSSQQLRCWEDIFLAKGKILLNVRFLSLSGDGWWRCLHKRNNTTELKIINFKLSLFTIVQIFFLSSLFSQTTKIMQLWKLS